MASACIALCITALLWSLPVAAWCVFHLQLDRAAVASYASAVFALSLNGLFLAPLIGSHVARPRIMRARQASIVFLVTWCAIAFTWELGWLVAYPFMEQLENTYVGYVWWVYIDAGDRRYLDAPATLVAMEYLSVCNAAVCAVSLIYVQWGGAAKAGKQGANAKPAMVSRAPAWALLGLVAVSTVHLYSTALYFASEVLEGCPSCDWEHPVNVVFAFVLANVPWLYMPPVVIWWAYKELIAS